MYGRSLSVMGLETVSGQIMTYPNSLLGWHDYHVAMIQHMRGVSASWERMGITGARNRHRVLSTPVKPGNAHLRPLKSGLTTD